MVFGVPSRVPPGGSFLDGPCLVQKVDFFSLCCQGERRRRVVVFCCGGGKRKEGRKKESKARLFAVVVGTTRVRSGSFACFHFYMFACVCLCVHFYYV